MKTTIDSYKQLLDVAQVGWWEADFSQKMFYFSDYLVGLMGLEDENISFATCAEKIRADHRSRIISEFYKAEAIETYEQVFPVMTCYGWKWVRSKLSSISKDADGTTHAVGVVQLMADQYACDGLDKVRMRVNEVLNHMGNLSRILQSFTCTKNLDDSVNKVLRYLLDSFDGIVGHVFLMSFDYRNQTFTCEYETCTEGRTPNISIWQRVPMNAFPWFIEKLTKGVPVILNSINDLPPSANAEREILKAKQICSLIMVPLKDKEVVTGFIGLDTYHTCRLWNNDDYLWLTSAANLISSFADMVKTLDALEKNEELFNLISQFAGVGYARYNLKTLEGIALDQWYYNLGEEPGTPFNEIIGIYKSVHPDDKKPFVEFVDKVKRNETDQIQGDIRVLTPDGWMWSRASIMKNPGSIDPENVDMISLNIDISEIKLSEERKNKAEELERVKTAFLANITHDIKTPLNAIVGFSSLLGEIDDPEERESYVEIIRMNNDLLLQLISNVLDLAKIESGMIRLNYTSVDLKEVLYGLAASMRIKLPGQVDLLVAADLPECTILTDRLRLIQVISNLVNNAIKYTEQGSITIAYLLKPGEVTFTVTDTGEGIPPEMQERIFDRFYKGHKQGTGLGLSICQGIVEQFGGRMGVSSEPGKGSCFWFTHPC